MGNKDNKTADAGREEEILAAGAAPEQPPTFTVERLRRDCYSLFGVTVSTFDGATFGVKGEHTVEGMRDRISAWQNKRVDPAILCRAVRSLSRQKETAPARCATSLRRLWYIEKIGSMASESEATALAIDTFGSRAGAELAYAVRSGKFEIDEWVASVEGAQGTLAKTDEAADTLADKWTMASNSMNVAFSSVISPVVEGVSEKIAALVQGVGNFLSKNPAVAAGLTALAVGLGVVVIGVVAYTAAMAIASAATTVFGAIASTALWPITLIVAAVAALVAGIALLVNIFGSANAEFNGLTAVSKQHYEQLEELNSEYDEAVELYGENSAQAQQLAQDIAGLEAVYEASKMTLEEFIAKNDALLESHTALMDSYNSSMDSGRSRRHNEPGISPTFRGRKPKEV